MTDLLVPKPVPLREVRVAQTWRRLLGPLPPFYAALRFSLGVALLAVVLSLLVANRYRATGAFYLDTHPPGAPASELAALASEAGLAPPAAGISPYLVAELVKSDTVLAEVVRSPLPAEAFRSARPARTLQEHYHIRDTSPERRFWRTVTRLRDRITTTVGNRSGLVTISIWDHDPGLAAWLANLALARVQHYLGVARASRARAERMFVEQRERVLRDSLRAAERELAAFLTGNRMTSQSPQLQIREAQLRRQVEINMTLYSAVQRDVERARAEEVRETPVMTITATPVPPFKKSWPRRSIIGVVAFVLAFGLNLSRRHWGPAARALTAALDSPRA